MIKPHHHRVQLKVLFKEFSFFDMQNRETTPLLLFQADIHGPSKENSSPALQYLLVDRLMKE